MEIGTDTAVAPQCPHDTGDLGHVSRLQGELAHAPRRDAEVGRRVAMCHQKQQGQAHLHFELAPRGIPDSLEDAERLTQMLLGLLEREHLLRLRRGSERGVDRAIGER